VIETLPAGDAVDLDAYRQFIRAGVVALEGGANAWARLSLPQKLAVALALNRADWLDRLRCTMVDAIERAEPRWMAVARQAERALREYRKYSNPKGVDAVQAARRELLDAALDVDAGGTGMWPLEAPQDLVLALALILDRPEWLHRQHVTLAEAIERMNPMWLIAIPFVAKKVREERDARARAERLDDHP
jgi:hypothetical protein